MKELYKIPNNEVKKTFAEKGIITLPQEMHSVLELSIESLDRPFHYKVKSAQNTFDAIVHYRKGKSKESKGEVRYWIEFSCHELKNLFDIGDKIDIKFLINNKKKYFEINLRKERNFEFYNSDEIEQIEIIKFYQKIEREKIIKELSNLKATESEKVTVSQRRYKRDNKTIAQLKILRNFECQICRNKIKKSNGDFYVEAAHIKPKSTQGTETPDNILILCPNHHKEFDHGKLKIIKHTKKKIKFILNDENYKIDLNIK